MKQVLILISVSLVVLQANAQKRKIIRVGGNISYHIGTNQQKMNTTPLLFMKSGYSAGVDFSLIPKKGSTKYKVTIDYFTGANEKSYISTYAKENKIEFSNYRFTKPNTMGLSIMAGPQFFIFPKVKQLPLIWLDLKGGVLMSNQQELQFFMGQGTTTKEILDKPVIFVYAPSLLVNIIKTKKMFYNIRVGYSNYGGITTGVNITSSCCLSDCCCSKCGPCCKTPSK